MLMRIGVLSSDRDALIYPWATSSVLRGSPVAGWMKRARERDEGGLAWCVCSPGSRHCVPGWLGVADRVHDQGSELEKDSRAPDKVGRTEGPGCLSEDSRESVWGSRWCPQRPSFSPFLGSHSNLHRSLTLCLRCMIISSTSAKNWRQRWYFIHSLRICYAPVFFLGVGDKSTR